MDRVEEIEAATNNLPAEEFRRIARWFHERDQSLWDRQMDDDSLTGKIDFLFEEAQSEGKDGSPRDWPTGPTNSCGQISRKT
jgi:hypothetical protein